MWIATGEMEEDRAETASAKSIASRDGGENSN
jgi:hypothetical protein